MVYADVADVKARWIATTPPPADEVIRAYLEDATALIDADTKITPPVAERLDTEPTLAARARIVAARMVMRLLTNPDQIRSTSETDGPFSGTLTYATETLSGALGLTDADRALLSPMRRKVSTIMPYIERQFDAGAGVLYPSQVINLPEDDRGRP